jgi:hypothetical protein
MVNQETEPTHEDLLKMDNEYFREWLDSYANQWEKNDLKMEFRDWFIFQIWNRERKDFYEAVWKD